MGRLAWVVGVAVVLSVGATTALTPRQAYACSLADLGLDDAARLSDVVAVGELRTDGLAATLVVDGYYKGDERAAELQVDNRKIELAPNCGETPVAEADHAPGQVVAFLRQTDDGPAATYRGISAGRGIVRAEQVDADRGVPMSEAARSEFGEPIPPEPSGTQAESGSEGTNDVVLWSALFASAVAGALIAVGLGRRERRRSPKDGPR